MHFMPLPLSDLVRSRKWGLFYNGLVVPNPFALAGSSSKFWEMVRWEPMIIFVRDLSRMAEASILFLMFLGFIVVVSHPELRSKKAAIQIF